MRGREQILLFIFHRQSSIVFRQISITVIFKAIVFIFTFILVLARVRVRTLES